MVVVFAPVSCFMHQQSSKLSLTSILYFCKMCLMWLFQLTLFGGALQKKMCPTEGEREKKNGQPKKQRITLSQVFMWSCGVDIIVLLESHSSRKLTTLLPYGNYNSRFLVYTQTILVHVYKCICSLWKEIRSQQARFLTGINRIRNRTGALSSLGIHGYMILVIHDTMKFMSQHGFSLVLLSLGLH